MSQLGPDIPLTETGLLSPDEQQEAPSLMPQGPSLEMIEERAETVAFAQNRVSKEGLLETRDRLIAEGEEGIRAEIAAENSNKMRETQSELIKDSLSLPTAKELGPILVKAAAAYSGENPATSIEKNLASNITDEILSQLDLDKVRKIFEDEKENTAWNLAAPEFEDNLAKISFISDFANKANADYMQSGWGDYILDVGGYLIPGLQTSRLIDEGDDLLGMDISFWKTFAMGEVKGDIRQQILGLPLEVLQEKLPQIYFRLREENGVLANEFINSMEEYSVSDRAVDNMFSLLEIAEAGGIAKSVISAIRKPAVAAAIANPSLATAIGRPNVLNAANLRVADQIFRDMGQEAKGEIGSIWNNDFARSIKGMLSPASIRGQTAFKLDQGLFDEIVLRLEQNSDLAMASIANPLRPERLPKETLAKMVSLTEAEMRKRVNIGQHGIHSFRTEVPENVDLDGFRTVVMSLGDPASRQGFPSQQAAERARDGFQRQNKSLTGGEIVEQAPGQWFIEYRKGVAEEPDSVMDALKSDPELAPDGTVLNTFLSVFRNPDSFISQFQRENRKVGVHLPNDVTQTFREFAKDLMQVKTRKGGSKEFERFLVHQMNRQQYSPTQRAFELAFRGVNGRNPDASESLAYHTYQNMMDLDLVIRDTQYRKDLTLLGFEENNAAFRFVDQNGQMMADNLVFNGKIHREVPDLSNSNVAVLPDVVPTNSAGGNPNLRVLMNDEIDPARLQDAIDNQGWELIQIAAPEQNILKKFDIEDRVEFVLVKGGTKKNVIPRGQIKKNPGGHYNYTNKNFVQQATSKISSKTGRAYFKDVATHAVGVARKEMESVTDAMERARLAYKTGDMATFRTIARNDLMMDPDEIAGKYRDGIWDVNNPWKTVTDKEDVLELTGDDHFRNLYGDKWQSPKDYKYQGLAEVEKKYLGRREAKLREYGTNMAGELDGSIDMGMAQKLTPLESMQTALNNAVRLISLDDLKKSERNTFLARYADLLDATPEDIAKTPNEVFHNAAINAHRNPEKAIRAKAERGSAEALFGTRSDLDRLLDIGRDKIIDIVYEKAGKKYAQLLSDSQLMRTRDPLKFLRSYAFHLKLGMFNPVQLFLQAQTLAHASLITGNWKDVMDGLTFYTYAKMRTINRGVPLQNWSQRAGGLSADEMEELWVFMKRSGIDIIEGEHQLQMYSGEHNVVRGKLGNFLDKGTFFFREGERINRIPALAMAYKTWKRQNPGRAFDDAAKRWVLDRQDILTNRMTRKSAASVQEGWTSMATQFWSYQMRMTEAFLGKDLANREKLRLLLGYSMMYGVPGGLGAAIGLPYGAASGAIEGLAGKDLPGLSSDFYEDMHQVGINYEWYRDGGWDKQAMDFFLGGVYNAGFGLLAGEQGAAASQRFAPSGLNIFKDIADGDFTVLDLMFGAAGSIGMNSIKHSVPFFENVWNVATDDNTDFDTKTTFDNFVRAATEVSTINQIRLAMGILNHGEYRFRNGMLAEKDLNNAWTFLSGALGVTPQTVTENFYLADLMKHRADDKKTMLKDMGELTKKVHQAALSEDFDRMNQYNNQLRVLKHLSDRMFGQGEGYKIYRQALQNDSKSFSEVMEQSIRRLESKGGSL